MIIDNNMAENARIPREDFPVLSIFLDRRARAPVQALYKFARAGDDIADDPLKTADQRQNDLLIFRQALAGSGSQPQVDALRFAVTGDEKLLRHGAALLTAFENDQHKTRFTDCADLEDYYRFSANPVGRFLADLYGQDANIYQYTDALCTGLGLITNLRDCGDDLRDLDRIYIPLALLDRHGVNEADLLKRQQTTALKALFEAQLAWGGRKITTALAGATQIRSKNLRRHFYLAAHCGLRLARKMRRRDILRQKVNLHGGDMALCLLSACWRT